MATTTTRTGDPASTVADADPIDTCHWPPLSDGEQAATLRMMREPDLFDEFGDDDWVVFSGEEIVAAGPDHDEVIRVAEASGKPISLIVPMMGGWI